MLLLGVTAWTLWWRPTPRVQLAGSTMGTTWAVTLNDPDLSSSERGGLRQAIEAALADVNQRMSTWDAESELSRFNRHASTEPFRLSTATLEVMALAQRVSEQSGGAFDMTVGPLVAAWGFGAGARLPGEGPEEAELAALRERVGHRLVELDPAAGTARKRDARVSCDLSAIAKGYAVDEVARALETAGQGDFLVEVGGEVRARGERPGGGPWRLAIEQPEPGGRAIHAVLSLDDRSMATSGDYRSFYEAGGRRLSHIIDPRTGRPVAHGLASVSVVHRDAVLADAWATALSVLGPAEGLARAEALGLAAYLIVRDDDGSTRVLATEAFPSVESPPSGGGAPRDDPAGDH